MPYEVEVNEGEQDVLLKISPVKKNGQPAEVEAGQTEYIVEEGDVTIQEADDEKSAKAITGAAGVSRGRVRADADLGEGVVHIEDTWQITVKPALAENVGLTGEVIAKEPA
jgi:hypothetical protein